MPRYFHQGYFHPQYFHLLPLLVLIQHARPLRDLASILPQVRVVRFQIPMVTQPDQPARRPGLLSLGVAPLQAARLQSVYPQAKDFRAVSCQDGRLLADH